MPGVASFNVGFLGSMAGVGSHISRPALKNNKLDDVLTYMYEHTYVHINLHICICTHICSVYQAV